MLPKCNEVLFQAIPQEQSQDPSLTIKSKRLQDFVIKTIVEPAYIENLKSTFAWQSKWSTIARVFFWMSNLFVLLGGILSFLQVKMPDNTAFSVGAGISSVIVLILLRFGDDAKTEFKQRENEISDLLTKIGIEDVIVVDNKRETPFEENKKENNISS